MDEQVSEFSDEHSIGVTYGPCKEQKWILYNKQTCVFKLVISNNSGCIFANMSLSLSFFWVCEKFHFLQ